MTMYVALLRGVNVGGKNKLPMRELVDFFERAGCTDVKSYIQSGNVVFSASSAIAEKVPNAIGKKIDEAFGFSSPVIVRTAQDLASVVQKNPFIARGADHSYVFFLADRPKSTAVAALDPERSPGDEFAVIDREVYLHCPNGFGRSKLTNDYFDRKLATTSTARNWRTVLKLVELSTR
jgi:uncharacterized protein (DUF1697 family)